MTIEQPAPPVPQEDPRVVHTRKVVLSAAMDLLLSEGHEAVTPLRISDCTGIARTTIYRHWPDRRELIADAIREHKPDWAIESSGDLRTDLRRYFDHVVARLTAGPLPPLFATLIERAEHDPEFADLHCRIVDHRSRPLVAILEAAIERGELPGDLDVSAAIGTLDGPILFRRLITREPLSDEFVDWIIETFLGRFS